MSANFTPELNSYTDLTPFRYWCQKVLPLVYDDSLSYYELLCKVVDYLNKTMEDVNLAVEDVGKLHDAYDSLQTYVNTYFDNLDVQEEINNKLDQMVEDGTLRNIFSEDVHDILDVASEAAQEAIADIPENVTDWLEEHIVQETGYVIDDTLTVQGAAADAKKTGDEISALKSDFNDTLKCKYIDLLSLTLWAQGSIDPSNGAELTGETRIKTGYIPVESGSALKLKSASGYRYAIDYFNSSKSPVTTGRLHGAWQSVEQVFIIPSGIAFIRLLASTSDNSAITPSEGTAITAEQVYVFLPTENNAWISGYYVNYSSGEIVANESYSYKKVDVSAFVGGTVKGLTASPSTSSAGIAFFGSDDTFIRGVKNPTTSTYAFIYSETIPDNASYMLISITNSHTDLWCEPVLPWEYVIKNLGKVVDFKNLPSHAFADPVITWVDNYYINYSNGVPTADSGYKYCKIPISMFRGGTITGTTAMAPNINTGIVFTDCYDNYISGYRNTTTGQYKTPYSLTVPDNASYMLISLRKASESLWTDPVFPWGIITAVYNALINKADDPTRVMDVDKKLKNARHIKGDSATPLTLLHFSDLHKDTGALSRIMKDANNMSKDIDDIICTGDMVSNTYEQIASWWDGNVLTCIGNHETASYNAQTGYNWTALSMANRDAYYIAPFESGWDIVHTSGTSYYYKDYETQNIRLIVMDAMLYTGTPGSEATTQTTWLADLLSDAITNGYHVLIAIHSPHGGATAEECSFSKYGQGTMPTATDCNTPQTVIDAVATAITNGLHFIGYIVGHTHQDNIWDAEDNGKQLMYCVTCASTNYKPQWVNSDQDRGAFLDAYNLVTIDTANTLVKIVRGGGADIDDHMRTRKAICFNYSTGEKVGEVL